MRNIPSEYPNPFLYNEVLKNNTYDPSTNKWVKNGLCLICWLRTPTGRLSKYYGYIAATSTDEEFDALYERINQKTINYMEISFGKELKKGYTIDKVYIYQGFKKE